MHKPAVPPHLAAPRLEQAEKGVVCQGEGRTRGKSFNLGSLDKKHLETYKLVDFTKDGILLNKGGKNFTIKSSSSAAPSASPSL